MSPDHQSWLNLVLRHWGCAIKSREAHYTYMVIRYTAVINMHSILWFCIIILHSCDFFALLILFKFLLCIVLLYINVIWKKLYNLFLRGYLIFSTCFCNVQYHDKSFSNYCDMKMWYRHMPSIIWQHHIWIASSLQKHEIWYQIMLNIEFYAFYYTTLHFETKISDNLGEKRPNMTYFDDAKFKNINKECSIAYSFFFFFFFFSSQNKNEDFSNYIYASALMHGSTLSFLHVMCTYYYNNNKLCIITCK